MRKKTPAFTKQLSDYINRSNNTHINFKKRKWAITVNHKHEDSTFPSIQKRILSTIQILFL